MPDQTDVRSRPGRCENHPGTSAVGNCEVCGRALCASCAIPVRGQIVGRECVGSVLSDVSTLPPPPTHARRADVLAAVGFGVVLLLTILPWSRFGDDSGFVGAWSLHWSLVAALTALFGFGFSLSSMRRQADPRMTAWMYPVLALVVIAGAILHRIHPPPLSAGSPVPLFALVAACLPLAAGLSRAAGTLGRR